MPNFVPDEGSKRARIVLVGEAPGRDENTALRPFVGQSGKKMMGWWAEAGLSRQDFYITNVYPYQPPGNDLSKINKADLIEWIGNLHTRLAGIDDPYVIVPTGNTALNALTGKRDITKYRGSILPYKDLNGRTLKVIPTLHPAGLLWEKSAKKERLCKLDWVRIKGDSEFKELRLTQRNHKVFPSEGDAERWLDAVGGTAIAADIETPDGFIDCIGFASSPTESITIPLSEPWAPAFVQRVLALPNAKIFQNGLFDVFYLNWSGFEVVNWWWDTLAMHHCLDSTMPHDLANMASVFTREPYWKDEAKDPSESRKYTSNKEAFYVYNGKDVCVTHELWGVFHSTLQDRGLLKFYERHYQHMFEPLVRTMLHGIRVDQDARIDAYNRHKTARIDIRNDLEVAAGYPLFGPKGSLSHVKLAKFLYETLGLPKQYNRAAKKKKDGKLSLTTNEVALRKILTRPIFKKQAEKEIDGRVVDVKAALENIMKDRRHERLMEFLDPKAADVDNRMRCRYNFTTETGRLSSSKSPWETGGNLQNQDREIRYTFIPDEKGWVMLEADLSQAEDRVVAMLTEDPTLIDLARRHPSTFDKHRWSAANIFAILESEVTKLQRYLGKRTVHAGNYGMGPEKLSEILLKDGYVRTVEECERLLKGHFEGPGQAILGWQKDIRKTLMREKLLCNSWGRMIDFSPYPLCEDVYRRGYAFVPQSEVADLLNQWGLIPVFHYLKDKEAKINAQVHDALVISAPHREVYDLMCFIRKSLEKPRWYKGQELTIPVTFKLGRSWKGDKEYDTFPSREEVDTVLKEIG